MIRHLEQRSDYCHLQFGLFTHLALDASFFRFVGFAPAARQQPEHRSTVDVDHLQQQHLVVVDDCSLIAHIASQHELLLGYRTSFRQYSEHDQEVHQTTGARVLRTPRRAATPVTSPWYAHDAGTAQSKGASMPYTVASHRGSAESLQRRYGDATIIDITSRGPQPWMRFSPFYPHGGIPVPCSPEQTGASVEGIWQGLKVLVRQDVDPSKLANTTMRGLKRSARQLGAVLGHRSGLQGGGLLTYAEARRLIYLPTYRWVLDHRLQDELAELRWLGAAQLVVLLDYETNGDIDDLTRPLSHASLIPALS
jgi:hypothetical protein